HPTDEAVHGTCVSLVLQVGDAIGALLLHLTQDLFAQHGLRRLAKAAGDEPMVHLVLEATDGLESLGLDVTAQGARQRRVHREATAGEKKRQRDPEQAGHGAPPVSLSAASSSAFA